MGLEPVGLVYQIQKGETMKSIIDLVNRQAEDPGLWFIAETAAEAYLQQELRKLHALIEKVADREKEAAP